MNKSSFFNQHANTNGCISLLDAAAIIEDSSFFNCTAESSGAAIYADYSRLVMNNTAF